jgi:hypothetical protein
MNKATAVVPFLYKEVINPATVFQSTPSFSHPSTIQNILPEWSHVTCTLNGAMFWYGYGFKVIPIPPGAKKTAVRWNTWLDGLDPQKIVGYWAKNPSHDLGFIVGDDIIVFDADTPESLAALYEIEARFGITPKLVVKTTKGQHHYVRLEPLPSPILTAQRCSQTAWISKPVGHWWYYLRVRENPSLRLPQRMMMNYQ